MNVKSRPLHTLTMLLVAVFMSVFFMLFVETVVRANACNTTVATVVSVQGGVEARGSNSSEWKAVQQGDKFCPEETVRVLASSRAAILLESGGVIRLDQYSSMKFPAPKPEEPTLIEFLKGKALFFSRYPRRLSIETPFVNALSEGTEFLITVVEQNREQSGQTTLTVIEGSMLLSGEAGELRVGGGQSASASKDAPPQIITKIRPDDAIQWALYYPPVLSLNELYPPGSVESIAAQIVEDSIKFYKEGDPRRAVERYERVEPEIRDSRAFVFRASLMLFVGGYEEANSDIEKALEIDPDSAPALALKSIIAVTQNKNEKALESALTAVKAGPESVSARIALSYARQANFQINEALDAAAEAVRISPDSSLALARVAELKMATGDNKGAVKAAKKASEVDSKNSRAFMVLGFSHLHRGETSLAKEAFERAINLNPVEPFSRLGLGLAKIRGGDLNQGRGDIELAASLDPANPIVRSYLGKGFYEEGRFDLAAIQLDLAKALDPKDPTPYLYDAVRKQVSNRPVEAHKDLLASTKLNDNRAVQRSRFLLDSDLASRSVSQARTYRDLGFSQLALGAGWKAVNTDPSNYSAHRLLADSYSALPNSEISRLSALLTAQLLQPLNSVPVRPRPGNTTTAILSGTGPGDLAFNEFSDLFNRDRFRLLASGTVGSNGTVSEEFVHTGQSGRLSYSLSQFHYETDGYRENADFSQDVFNAFGQFSVTPDTSVQVEYRKNEISRGDSDLRFDPDNYSPERDRNNETDSWRFGLHTSPGPRSDILVSVISLGFNEDLSDTSPIDIPVGSSFFGKSDQDGYTGEVQYIYRGDDISLITGGSYLEGEDDTVISGTFLATLCIPSGFPPPFCVDGDIIKPVPLPISSGGKTDTEYKQLYLYTNTDISPDLTLTLGVSGEFYKGEPEDQDRINPKLGFIWNPRASTTVRAAAFRASKRPLLASQTLEPTQAAGFQQFFDDSDASEYYRYGLALEEQFSDDLFGGVEFTTRRLDVPAFVFNPFTGTTEVENFEVDQRLYRGYLYWTPDTWISTTAEYHYDRRNSNNVTAPFGPRLSTRRLVLGTNFFMSRGFFARFKASHISQKGMFLSVLPSNISSGMYIDQSDSFWVADASLGWRLPRGKGMLSIEAKNLFDKHFEYMETDPSNPIVQPEQAIFSRATLLF